MILGDTCTRACGFCAVKTGRPTWFDDDEPRRVAEAVAAMRLEHVVVTRVARDDLPDGGASIFAETIRQMRERSPGMGIEVLIPDFDGSDDRLRTVMDARPDILNHNLETVKRLQKPVRKRARWDRSLYVLRRAKEMAVEIGYAVHTKSSLMVGLGETRDELTEAFEALRAVDVDILTIGQYLRPSDEAPAARALLPPRRVRRDEGRGARARLQARRVGAARALELPRPRPGAGRGAQAPCAAARRRSTPRAASSRSPADGPEFAGTCIRCTYGVGSVAMRRSVHPHASNRPRIASAVQFVHPDARPATELVADRRYVHRHASASVTAELPRAGFASGAHVTRLVVR